MNHPFLSSYKLAIRSFLFLMIICFAQQVSASNPNQPTKLSINLLTHADQVFLNGSPVNTPLDEAVYRRENFQFTEIAQKKPFFGWVVNSDKNKTMQVAYQVLVASSQHHIQNNQGDYWNSGKVESSQSISLNYQGKALLPDSVYFWKVKTWDNHGVESAWSPVSQFKMAPKLLDYATARYPLQKQDEFPKSIQPVAPQTTLIDFGKAAFGRIRLTLDGTDGDTITLRLGEVLKDKRIDPNPGGSRRYAEYQLELKNGSNTYIITIDPDKRNTGPRAIPIPEYIGDVLPFRYVEIIGYNHPIEKYQIARETVFYPFDETESFFTSSDTILNQVWELCKYSIKATSFAGAYVDGDRERIPYEADALVNQLCHYGVAREYSMARFTHEYLIHHATWPTEWILQSVLMAWNDYQYTGNKESLAQHYTDLKAKSLLSLSDESGFISTRTGKVSPEVLESIHLKDNLRDIVDWPHTGILGLGKNEAGETDGFVFQDINTVVNAYHYFALKVMSTIAGQLGKGDESEFYSLRAAKLKKAFNAELIDPKRKIYTDGIGTDHASLHANMFPLAFGLVPDKNRKAINTFIRSRGMACSVYGSQFLMEAIYDGHNADYGLQLLTSTDERSWYNMIRAGSTISMEAWDNKYKPNQDWNHAWGAVPANIIPRKLMGIEPLEPGFSKIRIKPQPGNLTQAEIKCPTIRGDVLASFQHEPGKNFQLSVNIPANTTADVYLPFWSKAQRVSHNDKKVNYRKAGEFLIIEEVGSGKHQFSVSN
ncbi:family 78 glycoside hydrolase catalytic domain [Sunxiuqinia sp. sy24]|uniref:family 78 glycoside hydrolase catalytic domain n=1 Tax=Sunxiuqinia sp. sy24 TaxID=3461495 RepID=UPI00404598B3